MQSSGGNGSSGLRRTPPRVASIPSTDPSESMRRISLHEAPYEDERNANPRYNPRCNPSSKNMIKPKIMIELRFDCIFI